MRNYYKIMLGPKSRYAEECLSQGFIGADYHIHVDLGKDLTKNLREFNQTYIPIYIANNPNKSKVTAGQSCAALWTICKEINKDDIVVSPNGKGVFRFGEVTSDYSYHPEEILPHRRTVNWLTSSINRSEVSQELKNSTVSQVNTTVLTEHAKEIEYYISGSGSQIITSNNETIEDPSVFALEKHLEDFLVQNWKQTELGKDYDIYEEDGELVGQQYRSDTGPIDILAISKDKKELLVVELKKGRVTDSVVGQIQRYMGYVLEELAEENQTVRGVIIGLDDDVKIRRVLAVAKNIDFFRYQVSFKLFKA